MPCPSQSLCWGRMKSAEFKDCTSQERGRTTSSPPPKRAVAISLTLLTSALRVATRCLELLQDLGLPASSAVAGTGEPEEIARLECRQAISYLDQGNYRQALYMLSTTAASISADLAPCQTRLLFLKGLAIHRLLQCPRLPEAEDPQGPEQQHNLKLLEMAREFLHETDSVQEQDPPLLLLRSALQNATKQHARAFGSLVRCLRRIPWCFAGWEQLGQSLTHQRPLNLTFLNENERIVPHWGRLVGPLLRLYLAGTWEIAECVSEDLLETYRGDGWLMQSHFARLQLALIECRHGQRDRALLLFQARLGQRPHDPRGIDRYSDALFLQNRPDELRELVELGETYYPGDPTVEHVKGNLYALLGDHEASARHFYQCAKARPSSSSSPWVLLGQQYLELRQVEAAIDCYRRAVEVNPCDFRGWVGLGQIYELLDSLELSLEYYSRAAQLAPSDHRVLLMLAKGFQEYGRLDRALEYLEAALAACPVEARSKVHLHLGDVKLQMEMRAAALEHFSTFLEGGGGEFLDSPAPIEDPLVRKAISLLVQHYETRGDIQSAARWLGALSRSSG